MSTTLPFNASVMGRTLRVAEGACRIVALSRRAPRPVNPPHFADLPAPPPDALATSAALSRAIAAEIAAAGGAISFARYMELALYAPGMGYYMAGARKLGREGDFVTAPEISPLFAQTLARQIAPLIAAGLDHVLEIGAGSGALAADLLLELERLGRPPRRYLILELSADLRSRKIRRASC